MKGLAENKVVAKAIEKYSAIIFKHPGKLIGLFLISAVVIAGQSSNVETVEQQTEDFLPDSEPVINSFNTIESEFTSAGATRYTIIIQTDPDHPNSDEIRDVRNPRFLRYMKAITNDIEKLERVNSVRSPSVLFKDIPSSQRGVEKTLNVLGKQRWSDVISSDYQAAKIVVSASGLDANEQNKVANQVRRSIESHELSNDLKISYTGQTYIDQAFQQQSQNTMNLTSMASLAGVILVVILFFRSIYYGMNSLLTVIFGIMVGFGVYGILGMNITPQTSGAISLGIGIAVDFGIQPIARYREERKRNGIEESLTETLQGVITPMTVGLVAANIGFMALAVGKLTFLKDLGVLLTLTTTFAYITAFTMIPASIVFYDRYLTGKSPDMDLSKLYSKVKS